MVPGLEERVMNSSEAEVTSLADLVFIVIAARTISLIMWSEQIQRGSSNARADDTKSLKSAVLDWITARGQPLNPPLLRNVKIDRGYHHERTGALLCPAGLDWSNPE
jgi:hypothetical protein